MKMDKLGEEVSEKIKCAITAKLAELGVHIDNELPDYVMVLVANKKTQKQMDEDLKLFLGDSTSVFTTWLYGVLKKLEQFTITSKGMKRKIDEKKQRHKKSSAENENILFNKKVKLKNENNTSPEGSTDNNNLCPQKNDDTNDQFDHLNDRIDENETVETQIQHKLIDYADEEERMIIGEEEDMINLHDEAVTPESCLKETNTSTNSMMSNAHDMQQPQVEKLNGEKDEMVKLKEKITIVWESENKPSSSTKAGSDAENYKNSGQDKASTGDIKETANNSNRKVVHASFDNNNVNRASDFGGTSDVNRNSELKSSSSNVREKINYFGNKVKDARDIIKKRSSSLSKAASNKWESKTQSRNSRNSRSTKENSLRCLSSVTKPTSREPEKPSVPSLVKVTPRPVRPPGMQASCNLILKAVADAEKSVATTQVIQKKTQKKKEYAEIKNFGNFRNCQIENISVTLLNDRILSSDIGKFLDAATGENVSSDQEKDFNEELEETTITKIPSSASPVPGAEKTEISPTDECPTLFTIEDSSSIINAPRFIITLDSTASDTELEGELDSSKLVKKVDNKDEVFSSEETLTVVRQAFDKRRLGPRLGPPVIHDENSECHLFTIDEATESSQDMEIESAEVVSESAKSQTRCKYWPCCDAGSTCSYYHPTTLCRLFPSCPYGDKCLYIHPACKFADKCLNVDCPFAHTSATPVVLKNTLSLSASNSQVCKFYPHCTKPYCPFIHVRKPCKFGNSCNKIGCEFEHPNRIISKNPYKWMAENQ